MKKLKYLTSIVFLLGMTSYGFASNDTKNISWENLSIEPKEARLNGMTPEDFNENWVYASFLSYSDIKAVVGETDYQALLNSRYSFAKVIDLNGNEIDEAIRVGVYKSKDNHKGIFMVIFEEEKIIKVLADNSSQGFSVLLLKDNEIQWYPCMACGKFKTLKWSAGSYQFE